MKQVTHTRKDSIITEVGSGAATRHKSINAAKRASRELQKGGSVLRTIPPPKVEWKGTGLKSRYRARPVRAGHFSPKMTKIDAMIASKYVQVDD